MSPLRKAVQRNILNLLDNSFFTSNDFDISFEHDNPVLFSIVFKYDNDFFLRIEDTLETYHVEMSPGEIEQIEYFKLNSFEKVKDLIEPWCKEIREELKAQQPVYKEIDKLREIIEDFINTNNKDDEFSVEDINKLQIKFRELELRIKKLEEDNIVTNKQYDELSKGIKQVSENLEYYPKGTWIKTASSKLVRLMLSIGKSKEGRKVLADGAKQLLGID